MDLTERILQLLWVDPQQQVPVCYCCRCGGAVYGVVAGCIRCEEDDYDP